MADVVQNSESEAAAAHREAIADRVQRFLSDAITRAGGPAATARELFHLGFGASGEPYADATIRAWRRGQYTPSADIVLALARRFSLSLDDYLAGGSLQAGLRELAERQAEHERRITALEAGA